jgi:hypothetical protein
VSHRDDELPDVQPGRLQRWRQAIRASSTDEWLKYGIIGLIAERLGLFEVPHTILTRVVAALLRMLGL